MKIRNQDLGTYHLKVEFADGSGYIHRIDTGWRYPGEDHEFKRIGDPYTPAWETEEDLISAIKKDFLRDSRVCFCDCIQSMRRAYGNLFKEPRSPIQLKRLTLIRPDQAEIILMHSILY